MKDINNEVTNWLLEDSNPSMRYRTLTELLAKSEKDAEVQEAKRCIPESKGVTGIFAKLDENGLWPHIPKYYGQHTSGYFLAALAELRMPGSDPRIVRVVKHLVATRLEDFDVSNCSDLIELKALVDLGYLSDPRVQNWVGTFLAEIMPDGGYLCQHFKEKFAGRTPKSCIKASGQALMLYASLKKFYPALAQYEQIAGYFLKRHVIYKAGSTDEVIGWAPNFYPPECQRVALFSLMYALSKLGYGSREELDIDWELLDSKADPSGRYLLDGTLTKPVFPVGKPGQPNKWVTFYILLAKKYR